ncbi:hypothetical protein BD289DRAFT_423205, partial [Coniella lustricola]
METRQQPTRPSEQQHQQQQQGEVRPIPASLSSSGLGTANVHMVLLEEPDLMDLIGHDLIEWTDLSRPITTKSLPILINSSSPLPSPRPWHIDERLTCNSHRKSLDICHSSASLEGLSALKLHIASPRSAVCSSDSGYSSISPLSMLSQETQYEHQLAGVVGDLCVSFGRPASWNSSLDVCPQRLSIMLIDEPGQRRLGRRSSTPILMKQSHGAY